MSRPSDFPVRGATATFLFAVLVVAVSFGIVRRQHPGHVAGAPPRFSGAKTVLNLASWVPEAPFDSPVSVALLRDSATDRYYDGPATMDSVVATWESALGRLGARVRVVTPSQALSTDASVLVVPASPCLGGTSREAITRAEARGEGVLATWLTGIRDGGCRFVGYGLLTQLSGALRVDTLEHRDVNYVTFLRGGPLTADVGPGARLELLVGNSVAVRTPAREALYSDFMLNPQPAQHEPLMDGAVSYADVGSGRAVYWGFDLLRVVQRPWDREIALGLLRNSVLWSARLPIATISAWPNGKQAAAVIAEDVEDQFENTRNAVDSLQAAHFPGTYFLVSDLALHNKDLVKAMAAQGEIGTHTPKHQLLGGEPEADQQAALNQTQHDLTSLLGHAVAGLRPPEEQFDGATLQSWKAAGGEYVFGSNNSRSASPEILEAGGQRLVLLGRVTNDDFLSVEKAGRTDPRVLADEYLRAFDKVRALGGLYILSYHSQLMSRADLVPALATVARKLSADSSLWRATAGQVADWWLARSRLTASARYVDSGHLEARVVNSGEHAVHDAELRLLVGPVTVTGASGARIDATDPSSVRLALPEIPAHGTVTVSVSLTPRANGGRYAAAR